MSAVSPPPVDLTHSSFAELADHEQHEQQARDELKHAVATPRRRSGVLAFLAFGALTAVAAVAGARVTRKPRNMLWYRALSRPSYTPPDAAFGIVWPVLYTLAAASAARVWTKLDDRPSSKTAKTALGLWGAQLAFNGAWSPIFFGAHRPRLALADLALTLASVGAYAKVAAKVDRPAAWMTAPYLGWLAYAGAVNAGVVAKNRGGLRRWLVSG